MTTLRELRQEYRGRVAPEDFDLLAAFVLKTTKEAIMREPGREVDDKILTAIRSVFDRRSSHEPVAYIVGEKEFYGLPFFVTRDTLVPRPETEHLVEEAIAFLSETVPGTTVVDLGTGSGAIAVSVAHEHTKRNRDGSPPFFATDIDSASLEVAKRNAKRNHVDHCISFFKGNLLGPIPDEAFADMRRIVILANLPYLSRVIYESAADDVRLFEPESALVADNEGLSLYLELLDDIARKKRTSWKNIRIDGLFEISPEQVPTLKKYFTDVFRDSERIFKPDLSGRSRVFRFRLR